MNKFSFLFSLILLQSCSPITKVNYNNYAYSIITLIDNVNESQETSDKKFPHPFYLYKNKIIEFVLRKNTNTETILKRASNTKSFEEGLSKKLISYDTIVLQIINPMTNTYIQIDSFRNDFKILKMGNYKDSPIGLKLNLSTGFKTSDSLDLRDTIINKQSFKYSISYSKDTNGNDSVLIRGYLINLKNFSTVFNLSGVTNPSSTLAFAGFNAYFCKEHFTYSIQVEGVRKLTKREELICESIYSKTLK